MCPVADTSAECLQRRYIREDGKRDRRWPVRFVDNEYNYLAIYLAPRSLESAPAAAVRHLTP